MTDEEIIAAAREYAQNKRIGGTAIRVFMDGFKAGYKKAKEE